MSTGAREKKSTSPSRASQRKHGASEAALSAQDAVSPAQSHAAEPAIAQRTVCPCGGGCPRCAAKKSGSTAALDSSPVKDSILHRMEGAFGTSFQDVRIRTDAEAADRAQSLRAQAYTDGKEIGFARDVFRPDTQQGLFTIAHEFAHVLQGRGGNGGRMPNGQLPSGSSPLRLRAQRPAASQADPAEVNADAAAHQVIAGRSPEVAPFAFEGRPRLISTDIAGQLSNPTSVTDPTSSGTSSNPDFINAQILQQQDLARSAYAQGQVDQGNQFLSDAEPLKKKLEQQAMQAVQSMIDRCTPKVQELFHLFAEANRLAELKKGEILNQQELAQSADQKGQMDQASKFRRDTLELRDAIAQYKKQAEEYARQIMEMLQQEVQHLSKEVPDKPAQKKELPPPTPDVQGKPTNKPSFFDRKFYLQFTSSLQDGITGGLKGSEKSSTALVGALQLRGLPNSNFLQSPTAGIGVARSDSTTPAKPTPSTSYSVQGQVSVYPYQAKLDLFNLGKTDIGLQVSETIKGPPITSDTAINLVLQQHVGQNGLIILTGTTGYEDGPKSGIFLGASIALRVSWP